jgi:hypothetical protein
MAPVPKRIVEVREPFPGNINVTPLPHEPPIRSRPILQTHPSMPSVTVHIKMPYTSSHHYTGDSFNWPVFLLFLILSASLGVVLSKWGWNKITGKIWKMLSGWDSPLVDEDEEELLPETSEEDTARKDTTHSVLVNEVQSLSSDIDQTPVEEWICSHTRGV